MLAAFAEAVPRKVVKESMTALTWPGYKHWMYIGVRTKRYSSDEYIVPLASIVSVDLEGRTDFPDYTWPMRGHEDDSAELRMRYEIALNEMKRSANDSGSGGAARHAERSALDKVYALAE